MRTTLLATFALLACSACQGPTPIASFGLRATLPETPPEGIIEGEDSLGSPAYLPGTTVCLVPFARTIERHWWQDPDNFTEGGRATQGVPGSGMAPLHGITWGSHVRWHNAILTDLDTEEEWLLLADRGVISRWWMHLEVVDGKAISRALAFAVTMDDTNGDGALDDLDAALVLVTDGDGRNPRFVSPPEQQVASLEFAAGGDVLLLMLRADANGDSEFEADEPLTPWVVDVPSGSKARRLVGSESPGAASGLLGDG